ncbi:unnamed protein product [Caenorhabditis auriculariae]|uniref:Uncharacterized protein n=1 Tax=Caenorhabditis auriculariae TaxID=2777116 RepID=A0A8S1HR04_9PELO|nr:unnamed protein product [Caenorhabditis auriculariae]
MKVASRVILFAGLSFFFFIEETVSNGEVQISFDNVPKENDSKYLNEVYSTKGLDKIDVTVTIFQVEKETTSNYTIILVKLDRNYKTLNRMEIEKSQFVYSNKRSVFKKSYEQANLKDCWMSRSVWNWCLIGADVVFIRYENVPRNVWRIDGVSVKVAVEFNGDNYVAEKNQEYIYEHTVYLPYRSFINERRTYQLGPRPTFFHAHVSSNPERLPVCDFIPYEDDSTDET